MKTGKLKSMASKYRYWRKPTKVGYNRKGYNFNKSVKAYKKLGSWNHVKDGSGHRAGYEWAKQKAIDPSSTAKRYSKNSPSFDEGVYQYKHELKTKGATQTKMANMVQKTKTLSFGKKASTPPKKQDVKV